MRDQRALPTSLAVLLFAAVSGAAEIGREVAVPRHLQDGEESRIGVLQLIAHGQQVFAANWTAQELSLIHI